MYSDEQQLVIEIMCISNLRPKPIWSAFTGIQNRIMDPKCLLRKIDNGS